MAKKSKGTLEKKIQDFFYWERERLIRMPGYKEAYRRYAKLTKQEGKLEDELLEDMNTEARAKLHKNRQKIQIQIDEILKRCRTRFMPAPGKADDWKWIMGYTRAVVKKPEKGEFTFRKVSTNNPKLFEIDVWREKEIILHEMSEAIDSARERDLARGVQPGFLGESSNPGLIKRRLAVFDLRSHKPPVRYREIVLKLSSSYGHKSLEKMINLARQDYQSAFEIIYGAPYKNYNKEQVEQFNIKTCDKCRKRKCCKEPCSEVEYMLEQADVKQQHLLGGARDAAEWGSEDEDIRDTLDD